MEIPIRDYCAGADCTCSAETCPYRKSFKWEMFNLHCKHKNSPYNGQLEDKAKRVNGAESIENIWRK